MLDIVQKDDCKKHTYYMESNHGYITLIIEQSPSTEQQQELDE